MSEPFFLPHARLQSLLDALTDEGFRVVGPRLRDGAILFEPLADAAELPTGIRDHQGPGHYRVEPGAGSRRFAWANGPQALKPQLFAGHELLWEAQRGDQRSEAGIAFRSAVPALQKLAVIGVRACDIAALGLHDAHFLGTTHSDTHYAARREGLLLVAVNCSHPAATCFCASTGDGPGARHGYDLLLDELDQGYLVRAGSEAGEAILAALDTETATPAQVNAAEEQLRHAAGAQTRHLPGHDLQAALFARLAHPRWDAVAERCLSCGNCTSVCPTCFCHAHVEEPALDGSVSRHYRVWDSCFAEGHSYIHGIVIRADTAKRYRQWLTHKLGSWHEQFGRSGCVGCGRCITWCPAGIDHTEEVAAILGDAQ